MYARYKANSAKSNLHEKIACILKKLSKLEDINSKLDGIITNRRQRGRVLYGTGVCNLRSRVPVLHHATGWICSWSPWVQFLSHTLYKASWSASCQLGLLTMSSAWWIEAVTESHWKRMEKTADWPAADDKTYAPSKEAASPDGGHLLFLNSS